MFFCLHPPFWGYICNFPKLNSQAILGAKNPTGGPKVGPRMPFWHIEFPEKKNHHLSSIRVGKKVLEKKLENWRLLGSKTSDKKNP